MSFDRKVQHQLNFHQNLIGDIHFRSRLPINFQMKFPMKIGLEGLRKVTATKPGHCGCNQVTHSEYSSTQCYK